MHFPLGRPLWTSLAVVVATIGHLGGGRLSAASPEPPDGPAAVLKAVGIDEAIAQIDPALRPPKRFALLIGVAEYQDERIPDLPACERDARDLAAILTDGGEGLFSAEEVTTLVNAEVTRNAVVAALDDLARKAGPDDLVVIFYSGHGATDEKGRAYWVMHDSRPDKLRSTALPELEISELFGEIKTRRLVTLIDACYSAATAQLGSTKSLIDVQRIYPEFQGDGRVGMTASKGDQLSIVINDKQDPGYGHSAFTYHVIEGLRGYADARGNADGVIELDELWNYVKDRTIETARRQGGNQEPQLKGQVGSRFMVAIDGERLKALAQSRLNSSARSDEQLAALKKLFLEEEIGAAHFDEARVLLRRPLAELSERERLRREAFSDLAEGRLAARHLARVLGESESPRVAIAPAAWTSLVAGLAGQVGDVDAPVALSLDLDALRDAAGLGRFVDAFAAWGGTRWSAERGGTPRQAVAFLDPFPSTADTSLLVRGVARQHRSESTLDTLLAEPIATDAPAATRLLAPRTSVTFAGDGEGLDRLLARPKDGRPNWSAALATTLERAMPIALVADGPWCVERLARLPASARGRIFFGPVYASLMLDDDPAGPQAWREATNGIGTVVATAQPAGEWMRTAFRLDFESPAQADAAAPHWRMFLFRLQVTAPDGTLRPLDVQIDGRSLLLRMDIRTAALLGWIDESLALPGSARAS